MFIKLTLLSILLGMQLPLFAQSKNSGAQVFDKVKPYVFQVKVAQSDDSPKASYGSGFIFSRKDWVATNYHVIASVLTEPERNYKVFVTLPDKTVEGEILAFDAVHDLAILKISNPQTSSLPLSKRSASRGEKIYSVGIPKDLNLSIIEGTYNGVLEKGPYSEIHMSSPLNGGMSGGPTVNSRGQVIGINVATLRFSQNISFAVPLKHLLALEKKVENKEMLNPLKNFNIYLGKQSKEVQDHLAKELLEKLFESKSFGPYLIPQAPGYVKCWQDFEVKEKKKRYEIENRTCRLSSSIRVQEDFFLGTYSISHRLFTNKTLNNFQFFNLIYSYIDQSESILGISLGNYKHEAQTPFVCENLEILTTNSLPHRVNLCFQAFNKIDQLYNFRLVSYIQQKRKKILVTTADFHGFSKQNINNIIISLLNKIKIDEK